ncbi:MAG: hypothetical protein HY042_02010, partial [Spirochaetia bacterium]|nr:hypothetical protein [Spirochaetia bacterium]
DKRDEHLLNDEEASALEMLTGGSIGPLLVRQEEPVLVEERKMAKKQVKQQKQVRVNPISIRSAVDRQFEDKTLSELVQAPLHALQGLTPRHSRMLEEAFGVKTIEDLAKLKYFEIAKAMVILSRYEK